MSPGTQPEQNGEQQKPNTSRLSRRQARELALKVLFQQEFQAGNIEDMLVFAMDDMDLNIQESDLQFTNILLTGIAKHRIEIDEILQSFAVGWTLARIGRMERSILRMALYELIWFEGIPSAATLDEAVELCKSWCAVEASSFINGILGNIHQHLEELRKIRFDDTNE